MANNKLYQVMIVNIAFCASVFPVNCYQSEADNFDLVMESDIGTFTPLGLQFQGTYVS